jgi:hypothetical protein
MKQTTSAVAAITHQLTQSGSHPIPLDPTPIYPHIYLELIQHHEAVLLVN